MLTPHVVAWGKLQIDNAIAAALARTCRGRRVRDKLGQKGVLYQGLSVMGNGAILGALMLGAIAAFVIDRQFRRASAFALAAAGLTFFGFMHGESIGIGQSPAVAVAYLGISGILLGCAKFAPSRPCRCRTGSRTKKWQALWPEHLRRDRENDARYKMIDAPCPTSD